MAQPPAIVMVVSDMVSIPFWSLFVFAALVAKVMTLRASLRSREGCLAVARFDQRLAESKATSYLALLRECEAHDNTRAEPEPATEGVA